MKKLKVLLSAVLTCVLAFSLAGCTDNTEEPQPGEEEPAIELLEFSIDATEAKTEFFVGESYSSEGLIAYRGTRNNEDNTFTYDEEISISECTIDSSEYNANVVGEYQINVSYTLEGQTLSDSYTVSVVRSVRVNTLSLELVNVKTLYDLGDEFTYEGLVATAIDHNFADGTNSAPYDVSDSVVIDSSQFNSDVVGTYTITVSYTKDETIVQTTYNVEVRLAAGLVLALPDGQGDTYTLSAGGTEIDVTNFAVYAANANGQYGDPITEGITFKAFRGNVEYTITDGKFTADQAGAYNIWAYCEDYNIPGTDIVVDINGFIIIYVVDNAGAATQGEEV